MDAAAKPRGSHDRPSFFNHSVELLDDLTQWIHARSEGVAPWVARSGEAERSFSLDGAVLASMGDLGRHHGPGGWLTRWRSEFIHGFELWTTVSLIMLTLDL